MALNKIERIDADTCLLSILSQNDLILGFASSVASKLLPKSMSEWADKMRAYVQKKAI